MPRVHDIKLRAGTAAAWTSANPVLDSNEPGYESDTGRMKIGDGATAWTSLGYRFETGAAAMQVHTVSRPASPADGQQYVDPTTGEVDIYVNTGTATYWLQIS